MSCAEKHLCEQNHIPEEKVMLMPVAAGTQKRYKKTYFLHDHLKIPKEKKILLYAGGLKQWGGFPTIICISWIVCFQKIGCLSCILNTKGLAGKELVLNCKRHISQIFIFRHIMIFRICFIAQSLGLVCYYPDFANVYRGKNIGYIGLSSGKFNTYLQHGVPVLALYPSYLAEITRQYHLGIGTTDLRDIDFAEFSREDYAQNCLDFFANHLSFEHCKGELLTRIENSLGGGGGNT